MPSRFRGVSTTVLHDAESSTAVHLGTPALRSSCQLDVVRALSLSSLVWSGYF